MGIFARSRRRRWTVFLAAAGLVVTMGPAGTANAAEQHEVVSAVLPVGASIPTLEQLKDDPSAALARIARQERPGKAQGAHETVGPAASYGALADEPSVNAPSGSVRATAAVPYPEPSRSMTAQECYDALEGAQKSFYVKSRFATCSGALFHQTWLRDKKPVGESRFVLLAVATIAKGSRTVDHQYHYLHMDQTGSTGTTGMMINPDATLPQVWPSTATVRQGGSIPGPRSWAAIKADQASGFTHTITADSGTGSGNDDAIFAVYQPEVDITFPAGWKVAGDKGGELFFLAPRWDKAPYLARASKGGAAVMSYVVPMPFSTAQGAPEKAAAEHIQSAYQNPGSTKPENSAKDIPGRTASAPLHRLYYDGQRRDDNRSEAIRVCRAHWGKDYPQNGLYECDEFPFSATYEGAAQALPAHDPQGTAPPNNFSAMPIPKADNGYGGRIIAGFYSKNRIIDGMDDGYIVKVS